MNEIDFNKLPNFFLIGAAKAGTTSMHDVLRQHPEIFLAKRKEPSFFNTEEHYARGLKWYQETHFNNANGFPRRGESTSTLLYWSMSVVPRIMETYGDRKTKFIAIFRDPVQRAYSHYWMQVHNSSETLSFEDALANEGERLHKDWEYLKKLGREHRGYYRGGCYATLLQPFLENFPRQDFAFVLLDDFQHNFSETMAGLANFLGVQSDFKFRPVKSNSSSVPKNPAFDRFLNNPPSRVYNLLKPIARHFPYYWLFQLKRRLKRVNLRQQSYPPMNIDTEHELRRRYCDEIEHLEIILERDLSSWKDA
jgi:hypothetical protein